MERFTGVLGILLFLLVAWAISSNRRRVPWRIVLVGLSLQLLFAVLLLRVPWTATAFEWIAMVFTRAIGFAEAGSQFVFGALASSTLPDGSPAPWGFIFAFTVLPIIIYFAALMALLYHFGIMQRIVGAIAWLLQRTLGVSGTEALSVSANIVVGQTEAPLCIRPYLPRMTRAQLMVVMTGGFATMAGSVLAAYVAMLGGDDPAVRLLFAKHLLSASIMSAPAAFVMARLMIPETEQQPDETKLAVGSPVETRNAMDAIVVGTTEGLRLALNVAAMLIAVVALIALTDWILGSIGDIPWIADWRITNGFGSWSLGGALGLIFAPVAWLMGVPAADMRTVGELLGTQIVATEFIAYAELSSLRAENGISPRATLIATYALCGFANLPSIAIQLGGLVPLAPEKRGVFSSIAFRAMTAGAMACWSTACIAGIVLDV